MVMASPSARTPSLVTDTGSDFEHEQSQSLFRLVNERVWLPTYSSFASAFEGSLQKLMVKRHYGPYNSVHVLFLTWKTSRTRDLKELEQLEEVFENNLKFTTERYDITRETMSEELDFKLDEAVRIHAGADELLIIYYAGHGRLDEGRHVTTWQATRESPSPENPIPLPLNWTDIEHRLNHSIAKDGNILYILDSCYTPSMRQSSSRGSIELLAAPQADGDYSLTTDLCDELQVQIPGTASISVLDLRSRIARRQARRQARNQIAEPYHLALSDKANSSSIVLASQTILEPRIPTTLNESQGVTLCSIKFQRLAGPASFWDLYIGKREVVLGESRAGNKYLGDYVEFRHLYEAHDAHLVIVLLPSEVSRMLVKHSPNRAFLELKAFDSRADITKKMVEDEVNKAVRVLNSLPQTVA